MVSAFRVPVFEQRVDNIVGIAYAMDLLDCVQKGELLESSLVGHMAQKPAYFVPDSMSVWNLLREFRIRKVHMAVVLNEYGGAVGVDIQWFQGMSMRIFFLRPSWISQVT
ncbi:hypothetical protein QQ045_032787 [Rhodiola kirilowii]